MAQIQGLKKKPSVNYEKISEVKDDDSEETKMMEEYNMMMILGEDKPKGKDVRTTRNEQWLWRKWVLGNIEFFYQLRNYLLKF